MVPWISPKTWLQYIVDKQLLYMLSGLSFEEKDQVGLVWETFWSSYLHLHPHFSLDLEGIDRSRLIALYIHGDEGRTLKKSDIMVTTLQSVVGYGFATKRLKRERDDDVLQVNYAGSSFLSRLVTSCVPKSAYDGNPEFFHELMDVFAIQLRDLLVTGLVDPISGDTIRFCVVGCKGDLPYLQKMGRLKRGWNTAVKRGSERKRPRGICHLCLAGTPEFAAEEVGVAPTWVRSIGIQPAWDTTPAVIRYLPHSLDNPGSFFCFDLWHCLHLGLAKSFVSSVVQLLLEKVPKTNMDDRWEWLSDHYRSFCRAKKLQPHVTKLTGYFFSYGEKTGATGNWSKGALSTALMKWTEKLIQDLAPDAAGDVSEAFIAVQSINAAMSHLYNAPLFLKANEAEFVGRQGLVFLTKYYGLAVSQFALRKPFLFPLYPKMHAACHHFLALLMQSRERGGALNPLSTGCQLDEDAIGKASRISRRVSIRKVMQRTLERYLMTCYAEWTEAKLLK